jgi:amino acid transporter
LCICFIRFYNACKAQGIDRDLLPFKGKLPPYSAWIGAIGSGTIVLISGFSAFLSGNWSTANLISNYIGIAIYVAPFVGWKVVKKTIL